MARIRVYTVPGCIDCGAVKELLRQGGIPFEEIDIHEVPGARTALAYLSGIESVPQVFIGERFIGQVAEVRYLVQSGRLQAMLSDDEAASPSPTDGRSEVDEGADA